MKTCFGVLTLALVFQAGETTEGPVPQSKWSSPYTEKNLGLKIKIVKYTTNVSSPSVKVILEFTKDLTPEELKTAKEALGKIDGKGLEFCFFDLDGVIFAKAGPMFYGIVGDISGMKGGRHQFEHYYGQTVHFPF